MGLSGHDKAQGMVGGLGRRRGRGSHLREVFRRPRVLERATGEQRRSVDHRTRNLATEEDAVDTAEFKGTAIGGV